MKRISPAVPVWIPLAAVIFLLGAGATRGLAREALRQQFPSVSACARLAPNSYRAAPGVEEQREPERPPTPTVWLRLPTVDVHSDSARADGLPCRNLRSAGYLA